MKTQQVPLLLDLPVAAWTRRCGSVGRRARWHLGVNVSSEQVSSSARDWHRIWPNLARF